MAFLGGSVSIRSFALGGRAPSAPDLLRGLADRAFRDTEIGGTEVSSGFVTRRDLFDVTFDEGAVLVDRHAVFGLRVDRRSVPASLLDAHVARVERAWRRENGQDRIPRGVRHEIRAGEKERLLAEVPSTPSVHPVLWNVGEGRLHFGSLASGKGEVLARLMHESFGLTLEPLEPEERATRIPGFRQKIAGLAPLDFTGGGVLPLDKEAGGSFLGRDFLTWLLHLTETEGGEVLLEGWGRMGLFFEDRMAFEGEDHSCRQQVLQQGHPSASAEAKTALLLGKKLIRARLTVAADDDEMWKLTIDADTLDLRSVKLPRTIETDPEGRLVERLDAVERAYDAVDALFREYLKRRTATTFLPETAPKLAEWVRTRPSDGDDLFRT